MPILKLILCCSLGWALYGQQEPPSKPPNEQKQVTSPAETNPKKAVAKAGSDKQPPSAAQKILDALDAAIQVTPKDGQITDISTVIGKKAELQARLNSAGEHREIAAQAAELLVKLYVPEKTTPPAPVPPREERRQFDYVLLGILVALISPVICVTGFWLGAKMVDNSVRRSLREAGLL